MRRFVRRLLPSALIALVFAPEAGAQRSAIEAENYTSYSDVGGAAIQSLPLSGCSGGYFLYGLDAPGEWTQYELVPSTTGAYSLGMKCRGVLNREYAFRAVLTPVRGGGSQTVEFRFNGEGFG